MKSGFGAWALANPSAMDASFHPQADLRNAASWVHSDDQFSIGVIEMSAGVRSFATGRGQTSSASHGPAVLAALKFPGHTQSRLS